MVTKLTRALLPHQAGDSQSPGGKRGDEQYNQVLVGAGAARPRTREAEMAVVVVGWGVLLVWVLDDM